MMARLRGDSAFRGDAFHQLAMGRDTDEAEAAATMLGNVLDVWLQINAKQ
jgi:hypothetical protein